MTFDAILTLLVIAGVLVVLILDRTSPAMAVLAGTVVLLLTGVIDADDAFAGFSNSAPLTVAALYVVAAAAARTRVIETAAAGSGAPDAAASRAASAGGWPGSWCPPRRAPRSSTTRRSSRWRSPG